MKFHAFFGDQFPKPIDVNARSLSSDRNNVTVCPRKGGLFNDLLAPVSIALAVMDRSQLQEAALGHETSIRGGRAASASLQIRIDGCSPWADGGCWCFGGGLDGVGSAGSWCEGKESVWSFLLPFFGCGDHVLLTAKCHGEELVLRVLGCHFYSFYWIEEQERI